MVDKCTTAAAPSACFDQRYNGRDVRRSGASFWLFGSRSAGCATDVSDWDILVLSGAVSRVCRRRLGQFDLVFVPWPSTKPEGWLGSELAAHVACYGTLICGNEDWLDRVNAQQAHQRKAALVSARMKELERSWDTLSDGCRWRRVENLRRDVQRVLWLARSGTVPPAAILDGEWRELSPHARTCWIGEAELYVPTVVQQAIAAVCGDLIASLSSQPSGTLAPAVGVGLGLAAGGVNQPAPPAYSRQIPIADGASRPLIPIASDYRLGLTPTNDGLLDFVGWSLIDWLAEELSHPL